MTRPLYRWKSFWFGLLVLIFLGWGWVSSTMGSGDFIEVNGKMEVLLRIDQSDGRVAAIWMTDDPIFSLPDASLAELHPPDENARLPLAFEYWSPIDGWRAVGFAHWFLILLFAIPWAGWLAWRWKRLERLHKANKAELNS